MNFWERRRVASNAVPSTEERPDNPDILAERGPHRSWAANRRKRAGTWVLAGPFLCRQSSPRRESRRPQSCRGHRPQSHRGHRRRAARPPRPANIPDRKPAPGQQNPPATRATFGRSWYAPRFPGRASLRHNLSSGSTVARSLVSVKKKGSRYCPRSYAGCRECARLLDSFGHARQG